MDMPTKAAGVEQICTIQKAVRSRGIFFGDNPLSFSTPVLLLQISLCAVLNSFLHLILSPFGESSFISQIMAGVILGPALIGTSNAFKDNIFPLHSFYICDTFAYFGVMLFLFLVGVKTDLSLIWKCGKRALIIGFCTFLIPLVLNCALSQVLIHALPLEPKLHRSLTWVASFQSLSSFHVIVCLLADLNLMNSELGKLAMSSSLISGSCSWLWWSCVFTAKQTMGQKKQETMVMMLLSIAIFIAFAVYVFRPLFLWMARTTVDERSISDNYITAVLLLILVCAVLSEILGQHFLFGPMILGIALPDGPPLGSALTRKLDCFVSTIILPIYFVIGGAKIEFDTLEMKNVNIIELLALFAFLMKVISTMLPSLLCKMPLTDALCLGLILSTQGITDVLILERAMGLTLIDKQSYSVMVLSMFVFTGITSPIVKYLYKPFKSYIPYRRRTIQNLKPSSELRMLACIHHQDHTPQIINLLEASYPNPENPICFYVIHLLELAGRTAPLLEAHYPGRKAPPDLVGSERIVNAFRLYEQQHQGSVTVFPYTSIAPYATMHDDVCAIALDKRVCIVIVPFHQQWIISATEQEVTSMRVVNRNLLKKAPCSVGILVDRGTLKGHASLPNTDLYRIGVIFLGGQDDREALAYASRMAKHPHVSLSLVRLLEPKLSKFSSDMEKDSDTINEIQIAFMKNQRFVYQVEEVKDSVEVISVIRRVENSFDLILVGRRHDNNSPLLKGLNVWNEFPELGFLGDMLGSLDSSCKVSVLVVQQHSFEGSDDTLNSPRSIVEHSSAVVDIPAWETAEVFPVDSKAV